MEDNGVNRPASGASDTKFVFLVLLVVGLGFAIASGFRIFSASTNEPETDALAEIYADLPFAWPPPASEPPFRFLSDAAVAAGPDESAGETEPSLRPPGKRVRIVRVPLPYREKPNAVVLGVERPSNRSVGYSRFGSTVLPVFYSSLRYFRPATAGEKDAAGYLRGGVEVREIPAKDAQKMTDDERRQAEDELAEEGYQPALLLPSGERVIPTGELHAKPDENVSDDDFFRAVAEVGLEVVRRATETDPWWLMKTASRQPDEIIRAANDLTRRVASEVEPNWFREVKRRYVPTDPYFKKQWHLENTGQTGGTKGADIAAVNAWDVSKGSAQVIVAVYDDGFDIGHTDLPSGASLIYSRDFVRGTSSPTPADVDPEEPDDHGTSVWGLIAAPHSNSRGVAGVAPGCRFMLLRSPMEMDERGIADAIRWAADKGAHIMSNSWGYSDPASVVVDALHYARRSGRGGKGTLLLFASGNENADIGRTNDLSNNVDVLAIGATTHQDKRTNYSNYGERLFLVAPAGYGQNVGLVTTDRRGSKGYTGTSYTSESGNQFDGTSGACPIAAGVAALVFSIDPERTADEVAQILKETADKVQAGTAGYNGDGHSSKYGFGRINATAAIERAKGGAGNSSSLLFKEDFEALSTGTRESPGRWSLSGGASGSIFEVALVSGNKYLKAKALGDPARWKSAEIDISGQTDVTVRAKFAEVGTLEANDEIEGYYQVDGGAAVLWFSHADDAGSAFQEKVASGISGSKLTVWIDFVNGASEEWRLDDIEISGTASSSAPREGGLFAEDFESYDVGTRASPGLWSLVAGDGSAPYFAIASVSGNKHLKAENVGAGASFRTNPIDISAHAAVTLRLKYAEVGTMEPSDFVEGYYQIDSRAPVKWFSHVDDAGAVFHDVSVTGLSGYSLIVWVDFSSGANEAWRIDDVVVEPAAASAPSARRRSGTRVAFRETFDSRAIGTRQVEGEWSTVAPSDAPGSVGVSEARQNRFISGANLRGTGSWSSSRVSIAGLKDVTLRMRISEVGKMEASDYMKAFYRINGGEQIPWFTHQGQIEGGAKGKEVSLTGINGESIELIVEFRNSSVYEEWRIDDIMISEERPARGRKK